MGLLAAATSSPISTWMAFLPPPSNPSSRQVQQGTHLLPGVNFFLLEKVNLARFSLTQTPGSLESTCQPLDLKRGFIIVTNQSDNEQIQQMAEEIFELTKLSWISGASDGAKDEYDLSESEFLTLDLLTKREPMNVGELQRSIGVLPAQMSRIIRSLEGKAERPLVECRLNPNDKRKIDVSLTDTGRQAHHAYQSDKLALTIDVLGDLAESDRSEFMRILRIIRQKFVQARADT